MTRFLPVDADQRREVSEHECPACGIALTSENVERGHVVCPACDARLEKLLGAWLDFAAIRDE